MRKFSERAKGAYGQICFRLGDIIFNLETLEKQKDQIDIKIEALLDERRSVMEQKLRLEGETYLAEEADKEIDSLEKSGEASGEGKERDQ